MAEQRQVERTRFLRGKNNIQIKGGVWLVDGKKNILFRKRIKMRKETTCLQFRGDQFSMNEIDNRGCGDDVLNVTGFPFCSEASLCIYLSVVVYYFVLSLIFEYKVN